jgi:hypothetical protein
MSSKRDSLRTKTIPEVSTSRCKCYAAVRSGSFPLPHSLRLRKRDNLLTGGGRGEEGDKSYNSAKAWSPIIHSILSGNDKRDLLTRWKGDTEELCVWLQHRHHHYILDAAHFINVCFRVQNVQAYNQSMI